MSRLERLCSFLSLLLLLISRKNVSSTIDCANYPTDEHILSTFPFNLSRNSVGRLTIKDKNFVPLTFLCFSSLKKIDIRNSMLNFSVEFRSKTIPLSASLETLSVEKTSIDPIFSQLTRLTRLKSLHLIETNLTSIDASIVNLKSLVSVNLAKNDFEVLPWTISHLNLLESLTISSNRRLKSLRPLSGSRKLRMIDARNCSIDELPTNLPSIIDFYLSNNNLKKVRSWETLGDENNEEKRFYFDGNDIRRLDMQMKKIQSNFSLFFDEKVLKIFPN